MGENKYKSIPGRRHLTIEYITKQVSLLAIIFINMLDISKRNVKALTKTNVEHEDNISDSLQRIEWV